MAFFYIEINKGKAMPTPYFGNKVGTALCHLRRDQGIKGITYFGTYIEFEGDFRVRRTKDSFINSLMQIISEEYCMRLKVFIHHKINM